MSKSIAVPDELYDQAAKLAAADHKSLDEFISEMLAQRMAQRIALEEFAKSRAQSFDRDAFERALSHVPDVEPEEYDRI